MRMDGGSEMGFGLDIEITESLLQKTEKIERDAAKKAVTLVKNGDMLPLSADKIKRVLIVPMSYWPSLTRL